MTDVSTHHVLLQANRFGAITRSNGDRTLVAFTGRCSQNPRRPLLSIGFLNPQRAHPAPQPACRPQSVSLAGHNRRAPARCNNC
jgi:hypothetical protein